MNPGARRWRRGGARGAVACLLLAAAAAHAQTDPDEQWGTFPGIEEWKPPPKDPSRLPAPSDPWTPTTPPPRGYYPQVVAPPPVPLLPNTLSMLGARPLGKWVRGEAFLIGFPLVSIRVSLGLAERFDVGLGFDSFYGLLNEPRLTVRLSPAVGRHWALAAQLEAGVAFFTQKAQTDFNGPRWMTGRRNLNLQPALIVSYQGDHVRAARLFLEAHYLLAVDWEPYQRVPLGGTPLGVQVGHNVGLKLGAELPLTEFTSFVFHLGGDVHLRPGDSLVMPEATLGLVTSF